MNWIPCKERMPEERVDVLVWLANGDFGGAAHLSNALWETIERTLPTASVTHWQPMPEAPPRLQ